MKPGRRLLQVLIWRVTSVTKLMCKSNPSRHVLLLLTKIIWKNTGTFWGIGGETAVALCNIAVLPVNFLCQLFSAQSLWSQ